MDPEPDVIHQQIDETRSSLTDKIEQLETRVADTVETARATVEETIETVKEKVEETVETVKDTVQGTVETVKRTFDLRYQTEQHPFAMMGCSFLAGCTAGYLLGGRRKRHHPEAAAEVCPPSSSQRDEAMRGTIPEASPPPAPRRPGLLERLFHQFEGEIDKVKETAIGVLMGLVRDWARNAVPASVACRVEEVLDSATSKMGGRPVRGPVLHSEEA
jgi:ElaB/YqjD/DUF883 family membrane-anchored ribosome-binding protein